MATVIVTHQLIYPAIYDLMSNPRGGVARDMYRRGQNVRSAAARYIDDDTGRLQSSLHVEMFTDGLVVGARIGSNVEYALAAHEGHTEIVPINARFLAFQIRGRWVFTKRVRAIEGTYYLTRALPAAAH